MAVKTGKTLAIVNGLWALVVGTLVLRWVQSDLWPHLISDGTFEGSDYGVLLGAFSVGVVVAAPSVFKTRVVDFVEAVKAWRGARKGE